MNDATVRTLVRRTLPRFWAPYSCVLCATVALALLGRLLATGSACWGRLGPLAPLVSVAAFSLALRILSRRLLSREAMRAHVRHHDAAHALRYLLAAHLLLWSLTPVPAIVGFALLPLGGERLTLTLLATTSIASLALLMPVPSRLVRILSEFLGRGW